MLLQLKRKWDEEKEQRKKDAPSNKKRKVAKQSLEQKIKKSNKSTLQLLLLKAMEYDEGTTRDLFEEIFEEIEDMDAQATQKEVDGLASKYSSMAADKASVLKTVTEMYDAYERREKKAKKVTSSLSDAFGTTVAKIKDYALKFVEADNLEPAISVFCELSRRAKAWNPEKMDFSFGGPGYEIAKFADAVQSLLDHDNIDDVDGELVQQLYDNLLAFHQEAEQYGFDSVSDVLQQMKDNNFVKNQ